MRSLAIGNIKKHFPMTKPIDVSKCAIMLTSLTHKADEVQSFTIYYHMHYFLLDNIDIPHVSL